MLHITEWMRRRTRPGKTGEEKKIERILGSARTRTAAADPATHRQWQLLDLALSRMEEGKTPARRPRRLPRPALALALGSLLVLVVTTMVVLQRSERLTYETGRGQQSSVTLADSTEVTLNHTSQLTVVHRPFERERHVVLRGEAFFKVRRNGAPFIVHTDVGTVRVLGTQFNLRAREGALEVTVVEGRVALSARKDDRDSTVVLHGGQIATCLLDSLPSSPSALPFDGSPGWTHGELFLYRTGLLAACREIEARFNITVHISNIPPGSQSITGKVDGRTADAAIRTLAALTGRSSRHENDSYYIF
jgi:transmembrane sensor